GDREHPRGDGVVGVGRYVAKIVDGEVHVRRRIENPLDERTVDPREHGSQGLMATDDSGQRGAATADVQRSPEMYRRGEVVRHAPGGGLLQDPPTALARGCERRSLPIEGYQRVTNADLRTERACHGC